MDNKKILELALENLENQRITLEADIKSLLAELGGKTGKTAAPVAGKRRPRTAAERKAQASRMRAFWAAKRSKAKKAKAAKKPAPAVSKHGPQTAAARKAQSERMKAYWTAKKAEAPKVPAVKKAKK